MKKIEPTVKLILESSRDLIASHISGDGLVTVSERKSTILNSINTLSINS